MKSFIPEYNILTTKNLNHALDIMSLEESIKPIAGGTDLMVLLGNGKLTYKNFINIYDIKELRYFEETKDFIRIGSLTSFSEIIQNNKIKKIFPVLHEAVFSSASPSLQNRATVGGNIANASPAADIPPALLIYDSEIELISKIGTRSLPLKDFYIDYKKTHLEKNELILGFKIPKLKVKNYHYFKKVAPRKALAISKICFAARGNILKGSQIQTQIAIGSVFPIPLRCIKTETVIANKKITPSLIKLARETLQTEISPITDLRSTSEYRTQVSLNILEDFLKGLKNARLD